MKLILAATLVLLALCISAYAETIPGVLPVDVYLSLEEKGFTTDKQFKPAGTRFMCSMDSDFGRFSGQVYCPPGESTKINVVVGLVQNFTGDANSTNAMSASFLAFIASLPYEGSNPSEAQAWVAANLGKETEKMFGSVKFQLFKEERTRMLRLSMEPLNEQTGSASSSLPAIKTLEKLKIKDENVRLPEVGVVFADVVKEHGKPSIQDVDTGWAFWTSFKAKFKDGVVVEAAK